MVQCGHDVDPVASSSSSRTAQMKAHAQRTARLQLIASMLEGQPWQQAIGSLLLLAAADQRGLLPMLGTTIQYVAAHSRGLPLNPAVIERLVLTLLFLPVAGLARTWDLRTYTGTCWPW